MKHFIIVMKSPTIPEMADRIFGGKKCLCVCVFEVYFRVFGLAHALSDVPEGERFMANTAAHHLGAFKMFWLHYL